MTALAAIVGVVALAVLLVGVLVVGLLLSDGGGRHTPRATPPRSRIQLRRTR